MDLMFPGASGWSLGTEDGARDLKHPGSGSRGHFTKFRSPADFSGSTVLAQLPESVRSHFTLQNKNELAALAGEKDPVIFFEGVLAFGKRMVDQGNPGLAAEIYSILPSDFPPVASGSRFEILLKNFTLAATDYRTIVPLVAGSLLYQTTKAVALGRMAAAPQATWLTRGWSSRLSASVLGMGLEVPTFVLLNRELRDESQPSLGFGQDLLRAALTLGVLRVAGHGSRAGTRFLGASVPRSQAFLLSQGLTFLALLGVHRLEQYLGYLPPGEDTNAAMDCLAGMLTYGVSAHLAGRLMPSLTKRLPNEISARRPDSQAHLPEWAFASSGRRAGNFVSANGKSFKGPPTLLMSSSGGNGGGDKPDPQMVHRVQTQVRHKLFEAAAKQKMSKILPMKGASVVTIDLHFDKNFGRLLTVEEISEAPIGAILKIRVRGDFGQNVIRIPSAALEGFDYHLHQSKLSAIEKDIIHALVELHGKPIGDLEKLAQVEKNTPPPSNPIIIESTRPDREKRVDKTQPLFSANDMVAPKEMQEAMSLAKDLAGRSLAAWERTGFRDQPPLLSYINPPVLTGSLVLGADGDLLGTALARPWFSGFGNSYLDPETAPPGNAVSALVSKEGTILIYHAQQALNQRQASLLETMSRLPKVVAASHHILREHPHMMELINGTGMGHWLLQINQVLGTGARSGGKFAQRMILVSDQGSYQILSPAVFRERGLSKAIAVFDAGYSPMGRGNRRTARFQFTNQKGKLPSEIRYVLDFIKWRVEKAPAPPPDGEATSL